MSVQILNGNELLIQGGLEAGFHLYTGYPGSPLADFFNILYERQDELKQKGIRVVIANSEANAAAMASGAKMAGQNVLVGMKSMGLHVASDALSVGNFANPGELNAEGKKSGVVIAVGDDPWSISTSTPADSRYLFKHLHIPFLEPSTPQELKDWMRVALELSQDSSVYVGVLLTTSMAEGGGRVSIEAEKKIDSHKIELDPGKFNLSENVMVPPNSLGADVRMLKERFPQYLSALKKCRLDKTFGNSQSDIGIISVGAVFETVKQVLEEADLLKSVHLYKVAGSYALNTDQMIPFLKGHEQILVVEEKRGFLEAEIKTLCMEEKIEAEVWGKKFGSLEGFPAFGGLNSEHVRKGLREALSQWTVNVERIQTFSPVKINLTVPVRLPTFCPGCPHRETLSIMKEIRNDLAQKSIKLISHGDVGCYSLSFLEPFKEMHDLSAMGQGGALGAGTDIFTTNPSVVLMGDSTFFHSGMTAISNSVQMDHNITYILLDNDNTAMTGHQVTPVSGVSVEGLARPRQSMLQVARSLNVDEAIQINPSDRYFYKNLLTDFVQKAGVKVIVSDKECGLTFHGRKKREERTLFKNGVQKTREFYQINTLACEDCRVCVDMTGCPGLSQTFDAYGTKVTIDPQICVSDSYCTKLKACPSFELVQVSDYHPTKYLEQTKPMDAQSLSLPVPKIKFEQIAQGEDWRGIVIGVGGSGVTTVSRVIAEAAQSMGGREDLDFKFVDQKGLAQRNGSVTSHLSLYPKGFSQPQLVPIASANVVVSPDLLEGARALSYLSATGVLIVDQDFQVPLSIMLDRGVEASPLKAEDLRAELVSVLGERVIIGPFKEISFKFFQKSVYSSAIILGVMFQQGLVPFSLSDMEKALQAAVPKAEFENNRKAFEMGRGWVLGTFKYTPDAINLIPLIQSSVRMSALPWQNKDVLLSQFNQARRELEGIYPEIDAQHIAQYIHDLIVFDHGKWLDKFLSLARELKKTNLSTQESQIALRVLAKTFWIKDEVFVSHLMISPLKVAQDKERYGHLGKKYTVVHINRPAFELLGKKIEFDFSPKPWMLKLMRHARFLRTMMPAWHRQEREIALSIRDKVLSVSAIHPGERYSYLQKLDNVKGYREVRYLKASSLNV